MVDKNAITERKRKTTTKKVDIISKIFEKRQTTLFMRPLFGNYRALPGLSSDCYAPGDVKLTKNISFSHPLAKTFWGIVTRVTDVFRSGTMRPRNKTTPLHKSGIPFVPRNWWMAEGGSAPVCSHYANKEKAKVCYACHSLNAGSRHAIKIAMQINLGIQTSGFTLQKRKIVFSIFIRTQPHNVGSCLCSHNI